MHCHFPQVNGNDLRNVGWYVPTEALVSALPAGPAADAGRRRE
jgi:hypothetical protein